MSANQISIRLGLTGLQEVTNGLKQVSEGVKSMFLPIAAGAAGVLSIQKIADGFKDVVEAGGKLNDMSQRIGTSVKNLVVQEQAFKDAGLGAENLTGSYAKLQDQLEKGFGGDSSAVHAFTDLGLSIDEMVNLDPGEQFERVAKAIGSLPNPTERTAAAMRIFGKSGSELIPLFRNGGAMDEARAALGDLPALMERNAEVLDGLGDAFGRIPAKVRGLFAGVIDQLNPEIKKLTDLINGMDLSIIGKKMGALVRFAIDSWNESKFDEFLGLIIEAGIELGMKGAKKSWDMLNIDLMDAIIRAGVDAVKIIFQVLTAPLSFINGVVILILDQIREVFGLWAQMFGGDMPAPAMTFAEAMSTAAESSRDTRNSIEEIADKAKELLGVSKKTREEYDGQVSALEKLNNKLLHYMHAREKDGIDRELVITGKARRINPRNDVGIQMREMLGKLDDQFGTLAEKIARAFRGITQSAVEGVAGSIRGLLTLTMSWGDALRNIGSSILNGVINAIATMFAEWIVQMTLVQGLKRIFHAEDKIQAGLTTATWAPAAATVNAATYGTGASIGVPLTLALILAAVGTIAALAFEKGGMTPGTPTLAMVGEKGPEFVIPADATRKLGLQNLSMLREGKMPVAGAPVAAGAPTVDNKIVMGVFNNPEQIKQFFRSNEGRQLYVDLHKQTAHERNGRRA